MGQARGLALGVWVAGLATYLLLAHRTSSPMFSARWWGQEIGGLSGLGAAAAIGVYGALFGGRMRNREGCLLQALLLVPLGLMIVGNPASHHMPASHMRTLDDLVADLPITSRFAEVEHAGKTYIVWVGMVRGAAESGPPVYVFDSTGRLVDGLPDTGDADNRFVAELHGAAFRSPVSLTPEEALARARASRVKPK